MVVGDPKIVSRVSKWRRFAISTEGIGDGQSTERSHSQADAFHRPPSRYSRSCELRTKDHRESDSESNRVFRFAKLSRITIASSSPASLPNEPMHLLAIDLLERGIVNRTERTDEEATILSETIERLAEVVDDHSMDRYLQLLRAMDPNSSPFSYAERLVAMATKHQQQKGNLSEKLVAAAYQSMDLLAKEVLKSKHRERSSTPIREWVALSTAGDDRRPWGVEPRQGWISSKEGNERNESMLLYSSFTLGETYRGSWATEPFVPSGPITFSLAGHNGLPSKPDSQLNFARLLAFDPALGIYSEVARAYPPRNDVAKRIQWNTDLFAGKSVIVEVVDGDNGDSYA